MRSKTNASQRKRFCAENMNDEFEDMREWQAHQKADLATLVEGKLYFERERFDPEARWQKAL